MIREQKPDGSGGISNVVIWGGEFQAEETASAKVPRQE